MNVFALDFDGVLCDSAAECAVTAWRGGSQIWSGWTGAEPPADIVRRFIKLRPLVETGYQCIPLIHLIVQGIPDATINERFSVLCAEVLEDIGLSTDRCAAVFSDTRDQWIEHDLSDWLSRHRFYPQVLTQFRNTITAQPVFIVTTKHERFVSQLLDQKGIDFAPERIFGRDRRKKKEEVLERLLGQPQFRGATFHFVEDRLETLMRVSQRASLNTVRLYLADWGYNTADDRDHAAKHERITVWRQDQFLVL